MHLKDPVEYLRDEIEIIQKRVLSSCEKPLRVASTVEIIPSFLILFQTFLLSSRASPILLRFVVKIHRVWLENLFYYIFYAERPAYRHKQISFRVYPSQRPRFFYMKCLLRSDLVNSSMKMLEQHVHRNFVGTSNLLWGLGQPKAKPTCQTYQKMMRVEAAKFLVCATLTKVWPFHLLNCFF